MPITLSNYKEREQLTLDDFLILFNELDNKVDGLDQKINLIYEQLDNRISELEQK